MTWGNVIAFGIGALIVVAVPWLWKRFHVKPNNLSGYTEEQADKKRERITGYAKSERDKIKNEAADAHRFIDDL